MFCTCRSEKGVFAQEQNSELLSVLAVFFLQGVFPSILVTSSGQQQGSNIYGPFLCVCVCVLSQRGKLPEKQALLQARWLQ